MNTAWYTVVPGKNERDMKKALYTGDSETLNVYTANIGGGLLGWAYFPKGYNNGRDYIDGVVMLDESMPGGTAGKYSEGDTLTHEVGHWLMLEHTFKHGCSRVRRLRRPTPRARPAPQFDCPVGADTCAAPGPRPDPQLHGLHAGLLHEHVHPRPGRADERRVDRVPSRRRRVTTRFQGLAGRAEWPANPFLSHSPASPLVQPLRAESAVDQLTVHPRCARFSSSSPGEFASARQGH